MHSAGNFLYDATTNLVGSTLGVFAPLTSARYYAKRSLLKTLRTRSYNAARRTGANKLWNPQNLSADAEIRKDYQRVLARARDLARNNPYVAGAVETFAANVVGPGIDPLPMISTARGKLDDGLNRRIEQVFSDWADWTGFHEKQDLIAQHLVVDGEILAYFVPDSKAPKSIPRVNIQLIECDQIDEWLADQQLPNGNLLRRGIEFDPFWRPVNFHVFDYHPGDLLPLKFDYKSREISASDMVHVLRKGRASQTRGISWLACIIQRMEDLDEYQDSEMIGAKLAAAFGIFIKSPFTNPYDAPEQPVRTEEDGRKDEYIVPGRIDRLLPGEEIQVAKNERPGTSYDPFVKTTLHGGAIGMGMSYESFSGDFSQSNFSSSRMAKENEKRKYRRSQNLICTGFNSQAYNTFLEYGFLGGLFPFPNFTANRFKYQTVKWKKPGWPYSDPLKDVQGDEKRIGLGTMTRTRILADQGEDYEDTIAQLGKEIALAKRYGVDVTPADKREVVQGLTEGETGAAQPANDGGN
jgi:lambda family phage portal protein